MLCRSPSCSFRLAFCLIILALATKTSSAPYTHRTYFFIVKISPTKSIRKNRRHHISDDDNVERRAATVKIRSFVNERTKRSDGKDKAKKAREPIKSIHEESADTDYIKMTINMWMRHSLHMQLGAYIYNFNAILNRNVRRFVKSFGVSIYAAFSSAYIYLVAVVGLPHSVWCI